MRGNMAAVAFAFAGKNIAHGLLHLGLKQYIGTMGERFARQRPVDFRVSPWARPQLLGIATGQARQICPVHVGKIDIVAKHHGRVSSVMHKHSEKQNNRKWNSDEPKQDTFSERHDSLHSMLTATRAGSIWFQAGCLTTRLRKPPLKETPGRSGVPAFRSGRIVRGRARPRH
jgi:hypothetical protein